MKEKCYTVYTDNLTCICVLIETIDWCDWIG